MHASRVLLYYLPNESVEMLHAGVKLHVVLFTVRLYSQRQICAAQLLPFHDVVQSGILTWTDLTLIYMQFQ